MYCLTEWGKDMVAEEGDLWQDDWDDDEVDDQFAQSLRAELSKVAATAKK